MSLVPPIKDNDWQSVRQAIQKLATKLGPTSAPTFSKAALSTVNVTSAVITSLACASATISSLAITSVDGFVNCVAVNSLPTGSNYEMVFLIPDVHLYIYG